MSASSAATTLLAPDGAAPAAASTPAGAGDWRAGVDAQVAAYLARVAPYERVVPEYELLAREAASLRRVVADQEAQLAELRAALAAATARSAPPPSTAHAAVGAAAAATDRRALEELQRRYYEAKDEVAALRGREAEGLRERLGLSRDNARLKEEAATAAAAAEDARAGLDAAADDVRRLTAVAGERDRYAREVARLQHHAAALASELQAREVYIANAGASAMASLNDLTASCEAAVAERDAALQRERAAVQRVADLEQQLVQLQLAMRGAAPPNATASATTAGGALAAPASYSATAPFSHPHAPPSAAIAAGIGAASTPQEMATSALSSARTAVSSVFRRLVLAPAPQQTMPRRGADRDEAPSAVLAGHGHRSSRAAGTAEDGGGDWVHLHPAVTDASLPLAPGHVFRLPACCPAGGRAAAAYGVRFHESCALLAVATGDGGGGGGGCVNLFSVLQPSRPPTRLRLDGGGSSGSGSAVSPGASSRTGRPSSSSSLATDVLCVDVAGRTVVGGCADGRVAVWALDGAGRLAQVLAGHTGAVSAVAYRPPHSPSASGLVVSGSADGTVRLWDVRAGGGGAAAACIVDARSAVHGVALSPGGGLLGVATAGAGVLLLDIRRPDAPLLVQQVAPAPAPAAGAPDDDIATPAPFHTGAVLALAFAPRSPEPLLLTCGADDTARLLHGRALAPVVSAAPGQPTSPPLVLRHLRFQAPSASRAAVAWSPDGRYGVAGGRNGYLYAFDVARGGGACAAELGSARDARRRVKAAAAAAPAAEAAVTPTVASSTSAAVTTTSPQLPHSTMMTTMATGRCTAGGSSSRDDGGAGRSATLAASAMSSSRGVSTGDDGSDVFPLGRSRHTATGGGGGSQALSPASLLSSSTLSAAPPTPTTTGIRFDPPHGGRPVLGVDWSSDGRWLASCDDAGAVVLWPA
jgi:WD40 repeat protein